MVWGHSSRVLAAQLLSALSFFDFNVPVMNLYVAVMADLVHAVKVV